MSRAVTANRRKHTAPPASHTHYVNARPCGGCPKCYAKKSDSRIAFTVGLVTVRECRNCRQLFAKWGL